jgi:hypothetical protein
LRLKAIDRTVVHTFEDLLTTLSRIDRDVSDAERVDS